MLKKISRILIFAGLIMLISYISLPNIKNFYYWKDDWIFMWANKMYPATIYREIGGNPSGWQIKTGLFMPSYARLYGKISSDVLQSSGIYLKFLNSLAVMLLAYTITKNKSASILASLLYASYSGGVEIYTWHRITALAVGFSALAFAFHNLYLETKKPVYIAALCVLALMAMFSFFGRAIGIIPLFATSALFHFYLRPSKFLIRYFLILAVVMVGLVILTRSASAMVSGVSYSQVLTESYSKLDVLFSNIGNILRIPFFKLQEEGGLVGTINPLSLLLGKAFFVVTGLVTLISMVTRSKFWLAMTTILVWMALTFVPNWMYASGGPSTMVGSSHRYMGGIGMGVVLLIGLVLSRLSRLKQILVFVPLLLVFLSYSSYILGIENSLRSASVVKPIYEKIMSDTASDPFPRALIVHTTRSNLVSGWLPYAYAYFKGLPTYEMFPTVFSNRDAAIEWACAADNKRGELTFKYGAPDNQKGRAVSKDNIYAWSIDNNGLISSETEAFRKRISECIDQI